MLLKVFVTAAFVLFSVGPVRPHGRLIEPPSRSTMWRFPNDPAIAPYIDLVEANYNDNQLFCGGFSYQQNIGGLCGVCGDPYDAAVKENEAGGKYAKGIIVREYNSGDLFDVKIEITAHHRGYFEFRLCPWNNPSVPITHDCLDQYVLETNKPESPRWNLPEPAGGTSQMYDVQLKLPDGVTCTQCVLQWKYHAGNSWGCWDDGNCCNGCGEQEEFYGCADISIGTSSLPTPPNQDLDPVTTSTTQSTKTTSSTTTTTTDSTVVTGDKTTTEAPNTGTSPCQIGETGTVMKDCTSFYSCTASSTDPAVFNCPPGTVFNEENAACDHTYNVLPPCGTKTPAK